jgi:S1-C subfamily serine protease
MTRRLRAALLAVVLVPLPALAVTRPPAPRLAPGAVSPMPSYVRKIEPSVVGIRAKARADAPSSQRLGARRAGSGVIFDARGYAVTVTYLVVDAERIDAQLRDGRTVPARLAGVDSETGLAVVRLEGPGPWPAASLGDSRDLVPGARTGTVGVDDDDDLVHAAGALEGVRRFSASWEYMLDRALIVAPAVPSWGGSALVDDHGRLVGVVSLRLGEPPHVNLAIPLEKFLPVKDELIATGRVTSRRVRPWLGLLTSGSAAGVVVDGFNAAGPARTAGFQRGDLIVGVDGARVVSQEEFYERLWRRQAGDTIEVAVRRGDAERVIPVRSMDRNVLYRTSR